MVCEMCLGSMQSVCGASVSGMCLQTRMAVWRRGAFKTGVLWVLNSLTHVLNSYCKPVCVVGGRVPAQ
jgi:hypothetical protein